MTIETLNEQFGIDGVARFETGQGGRDGAFQVDANFTETDITAAVRCIRSFEKAQRV